MSETKIQRSTSLFVPFLTIPQYELDYQHAWELRQITTAIGSPPSLPAWFNTPQPLTEKTKATLIMWGIKAIEISYNGGVTVELTWLNKQ
jgi:hypothetical protein